MTKVVVADAGPLIAFAKIDLLEILPSVAGDVIIPKAVITECLYIPSRPDAVAIQYAVEKGWMTINEQTWELVLSPSLGEGEQSAILLAKTLKCPVFLDDKLSRIAAKSLGLSVVGTAGLLVKAKQNNHIESVAPLIKKLKELGYYFSPALIEQILVLAGENES